MEIFTELSNLSNTHSVFQINFLIVFLFQIFQAYGSGCDIVILADDFECVQIIPGAKHGNIQVSCVECSQQQGRVRILINFYSFGFFNRIL